MNHLKKSEKKSCCPNCKSEFRIEVQCRMLFEEGNVVDSTGIGYLMELKCNCGTKFPAFGGTGDIEDLNNAIENNSKLIENKMIGNAGVGIAQQMLSALDVKSVTSYLMGIVKKK